MKSGAARSARGVWPVLVLALAAPAAADQAASEIGRRIYEEGILPDGAALQAVRPEGFVLEGRYAACGTCHRPSGMGSVEGSIDAAILVPPVAGPLLFAPARFHGTFLNTVHHWVPNKAWERALTRGAYDEASLARALRKAVDPDGNPLVAPMPIYDLDDAAVAALAAYLRGLSAEPAPGAGADGLHLATVVTPDAPDWQAESVLGVLRAWAATSLSSGSAWRLHTWELSGPAEQWQDQLEAHYAKRPVFAVLSGAGGAEWSPVQGFCEARRVPCILPVVDVAPESEPSFYSVYFSPGVTLEARLLARHLKDESSTAGVPPRLVQVYGDAAGRRAAEALAAGLADDGATVQLRRFRPTAPVAAVQSVGDDARLALWLRSEELDQLAMALPEGPAAGEVFVSALLAPPGSVALPPAWKARLTYVSLFDDLGLQGEIARLRLKRWLESQGLAAASNLRPQADAYAAAYLFADALGDIRGQEVRRPPVPLNREHLLEVLETEVNKYADGTDQVNPDSHVAHYGRMSLGPGQRIAVRGGMLMRYAGDGTERLVAASKRILP